jgi:hypothetical protein
MDMVTRLFAVHEYYTVNREIFTVLKVDEFAFFQFSGRQNSTFAAEI